MRASTVLALKYRPSAFSEVVGQAHVVRVLEQMLSTQRLHQAYLFSGTRGVGKTTLARLFAKCLNCETGVTATPCGECSACQEIAVGRYVDLIEVDAASRTRVEDTREMIENACYLPTRGRFKVYLIDEVHMLSTHSFNALLKTLEEPPEHVKFLLATTDPQKLPVTVLSRCLHFRLKSVGLQDLSAQIAKVLRKEKIAYEEAALAPLAQAARGSLRDALTMLEQLVAFSNDTITYAQVCEFLGILDTRTVWPLLQALSESNAQAVDKAWQGLLSSGVEAQQVLQALMRELHQLALNQLMSVQLMSVQQEEVSATLPVSPEWIQIAYQALVNAHRDLPHTVNDQIGVEMALLRILHCSPWLGLGVEQAAKQPVITEKKTEKLADSVNFNTNLLWYSLPEWVDWLQVREAGKGLSGGLRHILYNVVVHLTPLQLTLSLQERFQVMLTDSIKTQAEGWLREALLKKLVVMGDPLAAQIQAGSANVLFSWCFDRVDDQDTAQAYLKQVAVAQCAEGERALDALPLVQSLKANFGVTLDLDSLRIEDRVPEDII